MNDLKNIIKRIKKNKSLIKEIEIYIIKNNEHPDMKRMFSNLRKEVIKVNNNLFLEFKRLKDLK